MENNKVKKLWEELGKSDSEFTIGYEDFVRAMEDSNTRKTVYKNMREIDPEFTVTDEEADNYWGFQSSKTNPQFENSLLQTDTTQRSDATYVANLPESAYANIEDVMSKTPVSMRQEKYTGVSDDDLGAAYQDMLAKAEQKKKDVIAEQEKEYRNYMKENKFASAFSDARANPAYVLKDSDISNYVDNKEEFESLKKEIGVRQFESGFEHATNSTVTAESLVRNAQEKKNLTAEDERNLRKAEYLNTKSRELLDAGSKYGDESGIHNWAEGLSNDLFDRDIIAGVGLVRDIKIGNLVKKLNNGEQLSESENALLVASLNLEDVRYTRSFDLATDK